MNKLLTLTPNRRLARFLLTQKHPGKIMAWKDWLTECWQMDYEFINANRPLQCLSDWQSELIWQQVISEHNGDPLLNKTQAVQHARQAFTLVNQWECDDSSWAGEKSETDTFLIWLAAYELYCDKHSLLDSVLLPKQLKKYWMAHPDKIPPAVTLYGFDELNPEQSDLIDLWKNHGSVVTIEQVTESANSYEYLAFQDRQSQVMQAALFAMTEDFSAMTKDSLPIGIIVPNLQDHWSLVNRIFTDILGQNFNISAGQPLGQCPIIFAAIQCLQADNVRYLLTTPYINGGLGEQCERALCDEKYSRLEIDPLPIDFIRRHQDLPEQFKQTFNQALDQIAKYQETWLFPSEWIAKIFDLLTIWGWPGERTLSSEAHQAVNHFYRLITELGSLDNIIEKCTFSKILSLLTQRAHKTMFQPESNDKPVQVLGILEAAGLSFSHLWIMDMGSDTWPDKPSPNPFIPMAVQIKLGIPHASFARELRFAQTMTHRLLTSADKIILSYAQHGEEGGALILPSPLIEKAAIPAENWGERHHTTLAQALFAARKLEPMPELSGSPLQQFVLKGGVRVFQDQAACPFRAYARHRLSAVSLTGSQMGLSSRVKGSVLHDALENIWKTIKTRENLVNSSMDALNHLISSCINKALDRISPALTLIDRDLELKRLVPNLQRWLEMELTRGPFKITALEKSYSVILEGLHVKFRIDRIDEINSQPCIIDYKTGKVNADDWLNDRMDEPQLPLYACVIDPTPQAIAFAQIRKDKMAWKGLGILPLPGMTQIDPDEWDSHIISWKKQFALLATEYKNGHAAVNPKNNHQTCTHCDLHSFCRVSSLL